MLVNARDSNELNLLLKFRQKEETMKGYKVGIAQGNIANKDTLLGTKKSDQKKVSDSLDGAYELPSTKALITVSSSVALLHYYCSTLPGNITPSYRMEEIEVLHSKDPVYRCTVSLPIKSVVKTFVSEEGSKRDAKSKASLQACIYLHRSGEINDHLILINAVTEDRAETNDKKDAGNNTYREREEYCIPPIWEKMDNHDGCLYMAVFEIRTTDLWIKLQGMRKMCIITKKPLSQIHEFELFNDSTGHTFAVNLLCQSKLIDLNRNNTRPLETIVQSLDDYTKFIIEKVLQKTLKHNNPVLPYFIVPLVKNLEVRDTFAGVLSVEHLEEKIDWKEINKTIANDKKRRIPLVGIQSACKDAMVVNTAGNYKKYYVKSVVEKIKASSKVPLATIATFDDKQESNTLSSTSEMTFLQEYYTKNARTSLY